MGGLVGGSFVVGCSVLWFSGLSLLCCHVLVSPFRRHLKPQMGSGWERRPSYRVTWFYSFEGDDPVGVEVDSMKARLTETQRCLAADQELAADLAESCSWLVHLRCLPPCPRFSWSTSHQRCVIRRSCAGRGEHHHGSIQTLRQHRMWHAAHQQCFTRLLRRLMCTSTPRIVLHCRSSKSTGPRCFATTTTQDCRMQPQWPIGVQCRWRHCCSDATLAVSLFAPDTNPNAKLMESPLR